MFQCLSEAIQDRKENPDRVPVLRKEKIQDG